MRFLSSRLLELSWILQEVPTGSETWSFSCFGLLLEFRIHTSSGLRNPSSKTLKPMSTERRQLEESLKQLKAKSKINQTNVKCKEALGTKPCLQHKTK